MNGSQPEYLFVYGTLRRGPGGETHPLLADGTEFIGRGIMQGRLYELKEYPAVVRSCSSGDRVLGEVYRLMEPARSFAKLDAYEGCGSGDPEGDEYVREKVPVVLEGSSLDDGVEIEAWIYLYRKDLLDDVALRRAPGPAGHHGASPAVYVPLDGGERTSETHGFGKGWPTARQLRGTARRGGSTGP